MSKWLNSFLEFKNEAEGTRKFALGSVVVITLSLALLSVSGVVATVNWSWFGAIPTVAFALCVAGAEALAAVSLVRVLLAASRWRKIAGSVIFIGLAWVCVQNAKNGVHYIFPDRFAEDAGSLAAKAELAGREAEALGTNATTAQASSGAELERVRTEIAELKTEQQVMASQSPEGIEKAQALLMAQGLYFGKTDGIRRDLTESAMRARGEAIQRDLAVLKQREDGFMTGAVLPAQTATTEKSLLQIETAAAASAAFWSAVWLEVMLWVLEGARSLGLWVFVTAATATGVGRARDREDELAEAEHQNRLAALRNQKPPEPAPAAVVEPVVAQPPPEPPLETIPEPVVDPIVVETPEEPPELELTDAQRRGRAGGLATDHNRQAAKARAEAYIPVPSLVDRDDRHAAMKVAAE
jgi:hypothetical protein